MLIVAFVSLLFKSPREMNMTQQTKNRETKYITNIIRNAAILS